MLSNVKVILLASGTLQVDDNINKLNINVEDLKGEGWSLILGKECSENQGGVRLQRVCGFLQMLGELPFFPPFAGRSIPICPDRF